VLRIDVKIKGDKMNEVICRKMDEFFSEITKAVSKNGKKWTFSHEISTNRMVVSFADRDIKIGMNLPQSLGATQEWHEDLLSLPSGSVVTRRSRIDHKKIVPEFTRQFQQAVEDGGKNVGNY
jgi:hypothetical protein